VTSIVNATALVQACRERGFVGNKTVVYAPFDRGPPGGRSHSNGELLRAWINP
jgi:hypothetical protein